MRAEESSSSSTDSCSEGEDMDSAAVKHEPTAVDEILPVAAPADNTTVATSDGVLHLQKHRISSPEHHPQHSGNSQTFVM